MEGGEVFVPKMRSMKVLDVIKFLAPKCKIELIGIRPGEKLHEVLITEYEALRTKNIDNAYVIKPEFGRDLKWLDKKPIVRDNFSYSSDNMEFLVSLDKAAKIFQ
jgi:UDP-N-acetylglucosamine 4,6-dehydratase